MTCKAIVNGKVYHTETGNFVNQTIITKDEKIVSISDNIPENAEIIDATGMYVTPGLVDTFSQVGLREIGIRWEGDDSYEPDFIEAYRLRAIDGIYPFDQAFENAIASGVTTAHVVSSASNVLGAQTAVIHTFGKTADEMAINRKFGYSFSMGDLPKAAFIEKNKSPLTRMGIANRIRTAVSHIKNEEDLQNTPIFIRCHRADDIATAIRIGEEHDLNLTLVHATDYRAHINSTRHYPLGIIAGPTFQAILRSELLNLGPALYGDLHKQDIPFTFATDHPTTPIQYLQLEGALAWKNGVPENVILNGLTSDAAKMLKINHLTGSIKDGLYADLVIWNDHPLQLTTKAVRTFIKGNEVYKENELDA